MEKLLTLPTKKPYEGPHIVLPEARQSLISRIESLSARETQDLLIQYAGVDFSRPDEKTNTIEMMMLYQHSLRIMGHNLSIDGIYGRKTREAIMNYPLKGRNFQAPFNPTPIIKK